MKVNFLRKLKKELSWFFYTEKEKNEEYNLFIDINAFFTHRMWQLFFRIKKR